MTPKSFLPARPYSINYMGQGAEEIRTMKKGYAAGQLMKYEAYGAFGLFRSLLSTRRGYIVHRE